MWVLHALPAWRPRRALGWRRGPARPMCETEHHSCADVHASTARLCRTAVGTRRAVCVRAPLELSVGRDLTNECVRGLFIDLFTQLSPPRTRPRTALRSLGSRDASPLLCADDPLDSSSLARRYSHLCPPRSTEVCPSVSERTWQIPRWHAPRGGAHPVQLQL